MVKVIPANRKTVSIPSEHKYMKVIPTKADTRSKRQRSSMDEMPSVRIYEVRKP